MDGPAAHQLAAAAAAAAALRPAGGSNGSWRKRRPKTAKLIGMVAVVALSVGLTAVLYTATGALAALCCAVLCCATVRCCCVVSQAWVPAGSAQCSSVEHPASSPAALVIPQTLPTSTPYVHAPPAIVNGLPDLPAPPPRHFSVCHSVQPLFIYLCMFVAGFMGYLAFPHPHPDILLNFDPDDKLMQVGR